MPSAFKTSTSRNNHIYSARLPGLLFSDSFTSFFSLDEIHLPEFLLIYSLQNASINSSVKPNTEISFPLSTCLYEKKLFLVLILIYRVSLCLPWQFLFSSKGDSAWSIPEDFTSQHPGSVYITTKPCIIYI